MNGARCRQEQKDYNEHWTDRDNDAVKGLMAKLESDYLWNDEGEHVENHFHADAQHCKKHVLPKVFISEDISPKGENSLILSFYSSDFCLGVFHIYFLITEEYQ